MKKIISILTIVTICILSLAGCSNSSKKEFISDDFFELEEIYNNELSSLFGTTFFSSTDTKKIFTLIAEGKQTTESGYRILKKYLTTNECQHESIGQVWKLGTNCYLVIHKSRHLYLSKSIENLNNSYSVLNNIDNYNIKQELPVLNAPTNQVPSTCIIGNMTFANGQFRYLGEILFDLIHLGGIVKLSNYQISPDGTKYITATCGEKIILITEKNHIFNCKPIELK